MTARNIAAFKRQQQNGDRNTIYTQFNYTASERGLDDDNT